MSDLLQVCTRKGLFTLRREPNSGLWKITGTAFLGVQATMSLVDPRDGAWYVALTHGHFGAHLHRSRDAGSTWEEVATPRFPQGAVVPQRMPEGPAEGENPTKPASLSEIWSLESGGTSSGQLWAGTIPGALFYSDDGGDSWRLAESLWNRPERMQWFGGGKDDSGVHSICVHPQDPSIVRISISCGGVWETLDGGATWRVIGHGLRAEFMPPDQAYDPNFQDPHRMVACPASPDGMWIQHHNGVFRSTDGGHNWTELRTPKPAVFGFAVAVHPHDPNTAWFVPATKDEFRYPVDAAVVVSKTTDGGDTFEVKRRGLPQDHAYDIVYRHALEVDRTGERLAMGSSTGTLWVSEDGGESWSTVSNHLPPIYAVRFF